MTSIQLEKKLVAYTKGLPKEALQEIIDFIHLVRQKKTVDNITAELSELDHLQIVHLEEEFKDYKQLYPRE